MTRNVERLTRISHYSFPTRGLEKASSAFTLRRVFKGLETAVVVSINGRCMRRPTRLHIDARRARTALYALALAGAGLTPTSKKSAHHDRTGRVARTRHAERQVPARAAQQVVVAVLERIDAVVGHARGAAPDQHIAVLQRHALHRVAAAQAAPQKGGTQSQRHRDDGRRQVGLVLVAVQRELGAGHIAVDEAGIGRKAGVAGSVGCGLGLLAQPCGHGGPGLARLRVGGAVVVAARVRHPAPRPAVGHGHRQWRAARPHHGAKRRLCRDRSHLRHPLRGLRACPAAQQHRAGRERLRAGVGGVEQGQGHGRACHCRNHPPAPAAHNMRLRAPGPHRTLAPPGILVKSALSAYIFSADRYQTKSIHLSPAHSVLQDVFGYEQFRGPQEAIVGHVITGGDALVLMPTGGGKSLCYQVPAIVRQQQERGVTIVVAPLIAPHKAGCMKFS